ncbi:hypothetical protein [Streptomyces sp. CBMA29]|uniref:hypothetical protein n=1 Tax=Streptomyces sp. CBMA29 TaxID=1896314 RepID=UPI001661D999|nr:hypothetical protein [Streptomyces sp. CBMA29]MBD0738517.1 hypothetical protein [Streptomyces sp. CBMA29]
MTTFPPGDGPTQSVSVSFHAGTIDAVRDRVGKRGVSAYVENAVQRQIERDALDAVIRDHETRHGKITDEEIAAAEAELYGDGGSARHAA